MGNLTKFLKNKNTVTILGVIICLVILYAGYTMRINQKTALVDVYYANQTIQPKTKITDEMVSKTQVPESFIKGEYYKNYKDIVGKYSNYNTMIAKGSIFYSDLLVKEEDLPDSVFYDVNEGERVLMFPVNAVTTYGNSIMPGNIVDFYVKLYDGDKLVYGEMFSDVEVLAVKDASGKNVFENTEEERTPAYLYFALPEVKYLLFSDLNYVMKDAMKDSDDYIEVAVVPNTEEYEEEDPRATQVTSEYFYDFVLDRLKMIDDQQELYTELLNEMEQQEFERKNKVETKKETKEETNKENNNNNNR